MTHNYGGDTFTVRIEDGLGQGWYDNDWDQLPEIGYLATRMLKPGALVFDLGAHQSVVAMMLASKVKPNGKVIAVEANPHNARIGRLNVERNSIRNIEIVEVAISNTIGNIILNQGLNARIGDGTAAWGQTIVPSLTIDQLAQDFGIPDVIFIDIEGAEYMALEGATNVLKHQADFFVEVHVNCRLEVLGRSVDKILLFFPIDRFEILVRSDGPGYFKPIQACDPVLKNRFFLLALCR